MFDMFAARHAYDIFRKKAKSSILLYLLMSVVALVAFIHIGMLFLRLILFKFSRIHRLFVVLKLVFGSISLN